MALRLATVRMANTDPIKNAGVINVPVFFHVLHRNGQGNVSDPQIKAQIDVLNADYAAYQIRFSLVGTTRTDVS